MNDTASGAASRLDLNVLAAQLFTLGVLCLLGFAVGLLALRQLRRSGLRFTWALLAAPLPALLWLVDWHVGLASAFAVLTAAGIGTHREVEARHSSGEEARKLREARGPLRVAHGRIEGERARQRRVLDGRLAIGIASDGGVCRVPFGADRGVHALVSGATGSGKTVTQAAILAAHVGTGNGAIVIDPKGDAYLRSTAVLAARHAGVCFRQWTPNGSTIYNPLARGGPTEIADKAISAHQFSEPHYEMATRRLLGHALATMQAAGLWPPSLSELVSHMEPARLEALACQVGGETAERAIAYLDSLSGRGKSDLGGGRDRLALLVESELGPCLDPALGEGEQIDLAASLRSRDVLYFHLDADRYPAAAKLLAAALVIDLVGLSAELQGRGIGGLVVVDEFAALAAEQVSRLFARARSAGLSLLLATQSLADLRGARLDDLSDTLTEQVLSNIEYAIVHRVGDPHSAERFATTAGTVPSWTVTQQVSTNAAMLGTGEGTRTREREFAVLPDQFKRLGIGEAVIIDSSARCPAQVVRIWPPGM